MQETLDLGRREEISLIRDRLAATFGRRREAPRLAPISQFVKSFISGKTLDPVSHRVFGDLTRRFPRWPDLAAASPALIERTIFEVTFADWKAERLGPALRLIQSERPDFDLGFLGDWRVTDALTWLRKLPGVGCKIASSTLNFSTLNRPAFVVDTHVLRVLQRYGFVGPRVEAADAHAAVMAVASTWSAEDLAELHTLLKLLGQTVCSAKDRQCDRCPLQPRCKMGNSLLWRETPRRAASS